MLNKLSLLIFSSSAFAQASSVELNGSTQYLTKSSAIVGAYPWSMFTWFNSDDATTNSQTFFQIINDSNNHFQFKAAPDQPNTPLRMFISQSGPGSSGSNTTTDFTADTWYNAIQVSTSSTNRELWLNNGGYIQSTSNISPGSWSATHCGASNFGGFTQFMNGELAASTIWDVALSSDDRSRLAARIHPFWIKRSNIQVLLHFNNSSALGDDLSSNGNDFTPTNSPTAGTIAPVRVPQNFATLGVM